MPGGFFANGIDRADCGCGPSSCTVNAKEVKNLFGSYTVETGAVAEQDKMSYHHITPEQIIETFAIHMQKFPGAYASSKSFCDANGGTCASRERFMNLYT